MHNHNQKMDNNKTNKGHQEEDTSHPETLIWDTERAHHFCDSLAKNVSTLSNHEKTLETQTEGTSTK